MTSQASLVARALDTTGEAARAVLIALLHGVLARLFLRLETLLDHWRAGTLPPPAPARAARPASCGTAARRSRAWFTAPGRKPRLGQQFCARHADSPSSHAPAGEVLRARGVYPITPTHLHIAHQPAPPADTARAPPIVPNFRSLRAADTFAYIIALSK